MASVAIPLSLKGSEGHAQKVTTAQPPRPHKGGAHWVYFRPVWCTIPRAQPTAKSATVSAATCSNGDTAAIASTPPSSETAAAAAILPFWDGSARYVLGPADSDPTGIRTATLIAPEPGGNGWAVRIAFTGPTHYSLLPATRPNYPQGPSNPPPTSMEAIEVNGIVIGVPSIHSGPNGGYVVINDPADATSYPPLTKQQAAQLLREIRNALPST
jgi:hypothetical protein